MNTWNDYKEHVKTVDPVTAEDMKETEEIAAIVTAMVEQRNALGLSQRAMLTYVESHSPLLQESNLAKQLQIAELC